MWMHIFCFSWHKINVTIEPFCTVVWHSLIKQSAQDCSRSHTQTQSQQLSAGSRSAEGCPTECGHSPTNMAELIPKYNPTHKRLAALANRPCSQSSACFYKKNQPKSRCHICRAASVKRGKSVYALNTSCILDNIWSHFIFCELEALWFADRVHMISVRLGLLHVLISPPGILLLKMIF